MLKKIGILILSLILIGVLATHAFNCYQIVEGKQGIGQIKLNMCTGESWLLVNTPIFDESGKETKSFTYRWYPIAEDYQEVELTR
jgi:hypothetical protein